MRSSIAHITVTSATAVRSALEILDRTGERVLLLVDAEARLVRTLTDGDLRRYMLSGATMDTTLVGIPVATPKTIAPGVDDHAALELMNLYQIDHLPVVEQGRPVGLRVRHEIDTPILLSTPHLGDEEERFVAEAFATNWVAPLGPNVDAFERELAEHVGIGHAAALSSGTAAIHLALRLMGVGPGDTVFCSTLTFVASAGPIIYQGSTPVFIDSEPSTWNMSPSALADAFADAARRNQLPKAVIVVNLYGQSADMDTLRAHCDRYGVPIIEDAAESLGATYKGRASGTSGECGIYSFNGNKIITTSGGGMLVSNDREFIERARFLATQARDSAPYYEHTQIGYNYRMSNILAGIGRGQLRVLDARVASRRAVYARYVSALADLKSLEWMPAARFGTSTHWLSACTLGEGLKPSEVIQSLARSNIEARRVWKPMHLQPVFARTRYYSHEPDRDVAADLFNRGICLPSGSNMTPGQQERTISVLRSVISESCG